ncbi:hypothetical protein IJ076_03105 [Candidatus Saccharibacteria bacterium]|nr:hypothetical protein [Candidatus Saccharibacteria bacterium]
MDEYQKKQDEFLEVIKKYDPEEYDDLMNCPNGGIVEDHLDHLIKTYGTAEAYEKTFKDDNEPSD